jgi:hypothetical protein
MSITRYNKIYNLSLAIIVIYNILCIAGMILAMPVIDSIISKSALIYIAYAVGMLGYKIYLTKEYFLGNYAIFNLIAHGVLMALSILLILITVF